MTAPTWPQLAGWLATADAPPLQGVLAVRDRPDGSEELLRIARRGNDLRLDRPDGRVLLRGSDGTTVVDDDGEILPGATSISEHIRGLLRVHSGWQRSDFHRAISPVREVEVAGRRGWQVALEAPKRKFGPLVLVVDDETGILLGYGNEDPERGWHAAFLELDLTAPPDEAFVHRGITASDGPARAAERRQDLDHLQAGLPRVHTWPPGFLPHLRSVDDGVLVVEIWRHPVTIRLLRAADAHRLPDLPVRWQRDGWAYALDLNGLDWAEDEISRVQQSVVDRLVE